ncbi:hypothetical protein [Megasphaera vaginalis (ex Srinivasan et al. 2021)]|uniref:hypothetical protein n=1 Tax=Megasphaera vaginalis (ex Srinivasan et al. 2021) TaxID=1111454 RepID=UPI0003FED95C|nr:hypothetical protein [Megasphaera vaginalis (ex Srinivasan et al. 2021)]
MSNELLKQEIERAMDSAPLQKSVKKTLQLHIRTIANVFTKDMISKRCVKKYMK